MMGVDEARQHDDVRGIDHGGGRRDIGLYRRDLAAFDQDVGLVEIADAAIETQHRAALEQGAPYALLGVCRRRGADAGNQRGARGLDKIAPIDRQACDPCRTSIVTHGSFLPDLDAPFAVQAVDANSTYLASDRRRYEVCNAVVIAQRPRRTCIPHRASLRRSPPPSFPAAFSRPYRKDRSSELHHLEGGATQDGVGITQRLAELVVIVTLADDQLHGLAGGLERRREVARLALKFRGLQRAVGENQRGMDVPDVTLRGECLFHLIGELDIVASLREPHGFEVVHAAAEYATFDDIAWQPLLFPLRDDDATGQMAA